MAKKRGWFSFLKKLFIPETKPKIEKKSSPWGWIFGRPNFKQYPEISAPQKTLSEATEEQRKHVLAVAIATAAAAEAAVAAANAAAEVVKLTNLPREVEKRRRNLAATKIQSAYRGHLARKALSAMKGLVKLQAVVRGEIVRRKVVPRLKSLTSIAKTEPRMCQIRVPVLDTDITNVEWMQTLSPKKIIKFEELKLHGNRNMSWDLSLESKEELEALWFKKQEAIIKRERMKKYSYSHREIRNDQIIQEPMKKENGRQSCRFNQWNEVELLERGEKERSRSIAHPNAFAGDKDKMRPLKLMSSASKQDSTEPLINSPLSLQRRSFSHVKQKSIGDDSSLPNSPMFPTYMATTESAKAKTRSMSTPKQRFVLSESYTGPHSPYKARLSSFNSFNGEINSSNRKSGASQPIQTNPKTHCWE
ncbi:hypothetical protein ACH5RR_002889 [Cinchona calisaya]|uniref:DUF4005 domain-containing protein n=1 Tax=Cinchona calisaya TaxID=153742 RepID=A0ABD3AT93_9GENT